MATYQRVQILGSYFPWAQNSLVQGLYVLKALSSRALCPQDYRPSQTHKEHHKDIDNLRGDVCKRKIKLTWDHMTPGTEVRSHHEE